MNSLAVAVRNKGRSSVIVVWESMREKFKPCLLSHLHTPGQSLSKSVCVCYKNLLDAAPQILRLEESEGMGIQTLFDHPTST